MGLIEELLITLMYSRKAQLALWMGPISFIAILLVGHHLAGNIPFEGNFALLAEVIKPLLLFRYEHAAWGSLISFWVIAGKIVIRDRNRHLY